MSSESDGTIPPTRAARRAAERAAAQASERGTIPAADADSPTAEAPSFVPVTPPLNPVDAPADAPTAVPVEAPEAATADEPEAPVEDPFNLEAFFSAGRPDEAAPGPTETTPAEAEAPLTVAMLVTPSAEPATAGGSSGSGRRPGRRRKRPFEGFSIIGFLGEILLTAGALMLLYLVWQLWYNDMVERGQQDREAASLTEKWDAEESAQPGTPNDGVVPVIAAPGDGEIFATLRIPRFGPDYGAPLAGGVSKAKTLDKAGIGHYPDTQLPGQAGNFAVAGHRNTHGAPLNLVADLRVGDAIVIETREGWFTYRYRNSEYVQPTAVDVLNPVPREDSVAATQSVITLTSCNPKMSTAERIIAYGLFESFTPRADGAPTSLTPTEG